jgi:hypothetical protein
MNFYSSVEEQRERETSKMQGDYARYDTGTVLPM